MTRSDNLVFIGELWGTEELKAELNPNGDCERIIARPKPAVQLPDIGYIQYLSSSGGDLYELEPFRKPTWTWCETPTDEMARLRPRCEVRDCHTLGWIGGTLLSVEDLRKPHNCRWSYCARVVHTGDRFWQYCRVRLSANGEVMVDWEGEE